MQAINSQCLAGMLPECVADVIVKEAPIPPSLADVCDRGVLWEANASELLLRVPEIARLLISRREILIEPLVPDALEHLHRLLRRTPLAALLWLRGAHGCNGAAVEIDCGAVLLLGVCGSGKSSLAAALLSRGARLLADDVAPVMLDEGHRPVVAPVWPELALWPDAITSLFGNSPPQGLEQVPSDRFESPYWTVRLDRFCNRIVPLKAIYCLSTNRLGEEIQWEPVGGLQRLQSGALLSYHERICLTLGARADQLQIYGAIANVPYHNVIVPHRHLAEIEHVADGIMQALANTQELSRHG